MFDEGFDRFSGSVEGGESASSSAFAFASAGRRDFLARKPHPKSAAISSAPGSPGLPISLSAVSVPSFPGCSAGTSTVCVVFARACAGATVSPRSSTSRTKRTGLASSRSVAAFSCW